ncbi:MAG: hypothetical protein ABH836_04030 [Candidatus Omnitrophota bacterium]
MGIADSMKGITQNILNSYDERVTALAELVADTQQIVASARKTLKGFSSDRKKISSEQAENLSNFVKDLTQDVGSMLKTFNKNRRQLSHEQVKVFEAQAKNLAEFVKTMSKDVASMINDFNKQRINATEDLKEKLTKEIKEIKTSVKDTLKSTQRLMADSHTDMEKTRKVWQDMSCVLAKSRKKGIMPRIEAGEEVATVKEIMGKEKKTKKVSMKSKKGKRK